MAESNKKGTQGGTTGSGNRGRTGSTTGATDPGAGSIGASDISTGSGMGTGGVSGGSTGLGTSGQATGSTGSGMGASSRTSGTHEMSTTASRGNDESSAHGLIGQVKNSASETFQTVKSNTVAKLDEQKSTLSTGLMHVADNIRQLGSNLQTGQQTDPLTRIAADYSDTAANKLRSAADYFNTHDVNTMYRDVEGLARRNPGVFLGGAFALGFIAARFLKSSSTNTGQGMSRRSYDTGPLNTGSTGFGTNMPRTNSPQTSGTI